MSDTFAHTPLVNHLEVETHCNRQHKVLGAFYITNGIGAEVSFQSDRTEVNHKVRPFKKKRGGSNKLIPINEGN